MHGIVRGYRGVDTVSPRDATGKVPESFPPTLRKLQGFSGCYVFDDAGGVAAFPKSETDSKRLFREVS